MVPRGFWAVLWLGMAFSAVLPDRACAEEPNEGLAPVLSVTQAVWISSFEPKPAIVKTSHAPDEVVPLPPVEESLEWPGGPLVLPRTDEILAERKPPPELWSGSFELGLNGTEGNSRTFNFRFGMDAKRKTARDVFSVDLDYHRSTNNYLETANRLFFEWRYEWLIEESVWTTFVHGTDDYDEFRPFDVRVTLDAGMGRKFIDTQKTSFVGRFGAGAAREIGGPKDEYVPELDLGFDLDHKINDRQKLVATVEYAPNVTDFSDCRVNSKVGWEMLLSDEANLRLKLSVRDRYDSTPGDGEPNDLDYSTALMWVF